MTQGIIQRKHVSAIAEEQMRRWAIGLEVRDRIRKDRAMSRLPRNIKPYIAISRQCGAGGLTVAERVAEILHWQMFDKELLDEMSRRFNLSREMIDVVDEQKTNWILELLGKWISQHVVTHSEYIARLGQVVLLSARTQHCVFVGRGVQFLLPRERGLAVHLVAPLEMRIERIRKLHGMGRLEAKRYIRQVDGNRRDFIRQYFNRNIDDLSLYDMVINRENVSVEEAARLIVEQARRRFQLPEEEDADGSPRSAA